MSKVEEEDFARVRVHCVVQKGYGQLVLTKEDGVRVMLSRGKARTEVIDGSL
jgi:hypothetical protein